MSDDLTATRRRALKAFGAVSLAGGIGVQTSATTLALQESDSSATTSGAIESVEMHENAVITRFGAPEEVDSVDLLGPNGQKQTTVESKLGETAARFNLVSQSQYSDDHSYEPGTYEAVAYGSVGGENEPVGRAEMDLEPSASVVGFRCLRGGAARVAVRNDGTGPVYVGSVTVDRETVPSSGTSLYAEVHRAIAPGQRVVTSFGPDSQHPVAWNDRDQIAEYVGTTQTATFTLQPNGSETTSDLDLTYEGGPVERRRDYTYERVAGGELA